MTRAVLLKKIGSSLKRRGATGTIKRGIAVIRDVTKTQLQHCINGVECLVVRMQRSPAATFSLGDQKFFYLYHPYNRTWENERAIEVSIARKLLEASHKKGQQILEVGNVLNHYCDIPHTVVDFYERGRRIINEDIVNFSPRNSYDLIISVSTIEHIGYDTGEIPDADKSVRAIHKLKSLLKKGGIILLTFPMGYNSNLDSAVKTNPELFGELRFFQKISSDNKWLEVDYRSGILARYGSPYKFANTIVIAVIRAK